jgi:serine/threonine protein kinase
MEDGPKTPRSDNCREGRAHHDPLLNRKFFSKFRTIKKLGEGSFGKVYKAEYNNEYFALKFENKTKGQSLLENEATIMTYLKGPNIPLIKSYGYSGDYNILVMQLMDKSLEDIFNKRKKFSVKTTCMIGYQMVNVLQYIHDRHIIHRDIKPDNFVMGANENNAHLYLLDFGLAKKYRSSRTLIQYPLIKKKKLTGTARYASIHALEELEQSRRDDLESVGYVLMYFLRGGLPWQGLKIRSKEDRYKKILEKKKQTSSEELCRDFPEEFREFVEYTRNLEYTETPDYDMLRNKFVNLVTKKKGENFDYIYDWTTESDLKKRKDEIIDLAPSTNYPVSEKKSTQKEMESINSKKKLNPVHPPANKTINSENMEGNNIIIDGGKENNNNGFQSKCCIIF